MPPEIQERLQRLAELTDEELTELEQELVAFAEEQAEEAGADADEKVIAAADALDQVRELTAQRTQAAAERAQRTADALARVRGETVEPDAETPPEGDESDDGKSTETPPEDDDAAKEEERLKQVAAASTPPKPTPPPAPKPKPTARVSRIPRPPVSRSRGPLLEVRAGAASHSPGEKITWDEVPALMTERVNAYLGSNYSGEGEKIPVVRVHASHLEGRELEYEEKQWREQVREVAAAGGLCGPTEAYYEQQLVGSDVTPIIDSLPQFKATRGGIRGTRPNNLTALTGGVGTWTVTDDTDAAGTEDPDVKTRLTVPCPTPFTVTTEAKYIRAKFGNLNAMAFPEQVAHDMAKLKFAHARLRENNVLTAIDSGSTLKTAPSSPYGLTPAIFGALELGAARIRHNARVDEDFTLDVICEEWIIEAIRSDVGKRAPGDATEPWSVTSAMVESWFAARNLNAVWTLDGQAAFTTADGVAGPLEQFPASAYFRMYVPGTHLYLAGGELNVGIIRDSALNNTNDYEFFSETLQGLATVGEIESLKIRVDVCPNGLTAGPADMGETCTS